MRCVSREIYRYIRPGAAPSRNPNLQRCSVEGLERGSLYLQAYFRKNPSNFVQLFLIKEMEIFRFSGVHVS